MTNITTASFGENKRTAKTGLLYQYDYGQIVEIEGLELPDNFEIHISNDETRGAAKTAFGSNNEFTIPDEFLYTGKNVYCFIYLHAGTDDGETEYKIVIPVKERPKPSDMELTPQEHSDFSSLLALLENAVDQAEEAVTHYPQIIQDYWYEWNAALQEFVNTGSKATGLPGPAGSDGQDGQDGFSPAVTLSPEMDGVRVVITDQTGDHEFTLYNGQDGQDGKDGQDGAQGPKGDPGEAGPQGPKGDKGDTGDTGATGPQGPAGKDGTTPVRGTDYWTEADQTAIINAVLANLENAETTGM